MSSLLRTTCKHHAPKLARGFVARPKHTVKDPLLNSPNAEITQIAPDLTFIHRPPPTAESPLSYTTNPVSPLLKSSPSTPATAHLPPTVRPAPDTGTTQRLTQSQIDEIRSLRSADPKKWTTLKLAERFKCSKIFISMVAPVKEIKVNVGGVEMTEAERRTQERAKVEARWGERKRIAREVRKKRVEKW